MKRIISLFLALMLIASMGAVAMAAEETGSITINGISGDPDVIYQIYRLLDLESYDIVSGAYSYKANSAWTAFFATADAKVYFTTADDGYVTWTWTATPDDPTTEDEAIAAFAKMALAYAQSHGIDPVQSSENDGEFVVTGTSGKFSGLPLGYYLVDSTVGALCGLTTTNPNASVNAKNGAPTIDKQVQEDSTGQYGDVNTADVGQIVYFRTTINVHAGAQNYVLHDTMSNGLTFVQDTSNADPAKHRGVYKIELIHNGVTTTVSADNYTVAGSDWSTSCSCTFHVVFDQDFCDSLETNDKLIVYYNAMLNRNAVVGDDGEGNVNETTLEYGESDSTTATDKTTTYTFSFDIIKTDSQNTLIDGAKFKIYDAETGGNEIAVVLMDDGVTYRRARADEAGVEILVKNGKVTVVGFDNGTYYLEETEAPDGYNKLTSRVKFIISDANLDSVFNGDIYSTGSGVHVVNKSGTMLPETGGLGTLLFTVIGGGTALASGVILVTKKRMSKIEDED